MKIPKIVFQNLGGANCPHVLLAVGAPGHINNFFAIIETIGLLSLLFPHESLISLFVSSSFFVENQSQRTRKVFLSGLKGNYEFHRTDIGRIFLDK